jgi:hypothetical protein
MMMFLPNSTSRIALAIVAIFLSIFVFGETTATDKDVFINEHRRSLKNKNGKKDKKNKKASKKPNPEVLNDLVSNDGDRSPNCHNYPNGGKLIQCESTNYKFCTTEAGRTNLGYGGVPGVGSMYWYATPGTMTTDYYNMDKVWGGAHITLGSANSNAMKEFEGIKTALDNFSGSKSNPKQLWSPSPKTSTSKMVPKGDCGDKNYTYKGNHLETSSNTLNEVISLLKKKYVGTHWRGPPNSGPLHVSTVTSGTKLNDTKDIRKFLVQTDPVVRWDLALVKVVKDSKTGKVYIKRLKTATIYNYKT